MIYISVLASLLVPHTASAAQSASSQCLHSLAWQRWNYTKAHYNVTQSLRQSAPKENKWARPRTNKLCLASLESTKRLQRGESAHWNRLRLSRSGVKWQIRKQFRSAGRKIVLQAWKVVSCESSFHWNSISSSGDYGIWQINHQAHPDVTRRVAFSPELSTGWAWRASKHGTDFSPWVCAHHYGIA